MESAVTTANTTWNDTRVFPPDVCVLRNILDRNAAEAPDKVFVRFDDGSEWTYAQTRATVRRAAAALMRIGVTQDDHVLTWLPNSPDALRIWFAINYIGAVYVPMNIAWRGQVLENAVRVSTARFLISHADLADRILDIDRCALTELLLIGPGASDKRLPGFTHHDVAELALQAEPAPPPRPIMP
jgi:carnitine-CoA ligase